MSEPVRNGIYFDLDEGAYHADPALGSTDLRRLLISGPDYWWRSNFNPHQPEPSASPALMFGRALHRLVLEGHQAFVSRYVRRPDHIERMTDKLKAELCRNGEEILGGDDFDRILVSAELIADNPELATAFEGGMPEVSIFWNEEIDGFNFRCKARFDYLKVRGIGDLKSIRNYMGHSFPDACARAIVEHRYDIQAAHYLIGRSHIKRFLVDDLVYGDHDLNWLIRVAEQRAYAFQWVFFQADSAPICWSRSLSMGNPIFDIAERDRLRAIEAYRDYVSVFGTDTMWRLQDSVSELSIDELPRWYR